MRPTLLIIILLTLLAQTIASQSPAELHEKIRDDLAKRNYLSVVTTLRDMQVRDADRFIANNYDYLLGRVSETVGDTAIAMASFQGVVARDSVLKEYALWHLARLAKASGNLVLERVYLQELISFSPDSLIRPPAMRRMAESWFESGNYDLAIRQIESRPAMPTASPRPLAGVDWSRKDRSILADAYLRSGNIAKARELYGLLTTDLANPAQPDDFALAGVLGLDSTEKQSEAGGLSDYEHLRRASIYQFNRDFERARLHYAAIIDNYPSSGIIPDAIFQVGRGHAQQSDFTEAIKWFERVLERYPEHAIGQDALLQAASAYARLGKTREAVTRYRKFIEKYPEGERIDRAYLNIIDSLRDQREEIEALKWASIAREKFKGKLPEALATFAEARIYIARSDWENAIPILDRLIGMPDLGGAAVPGGTTVAEVRFLRGYALEQLRRYPDSIDTYLSIPDGRNEFYGARATDRLRLMLQYDASRAAVTAKAESLRSIRPTEREASRRALQASIRLSDRPEERDQLLASLRAVYAAIPAYSAPKFKFVTQGRQSSIDAAVRPESTERRTIADELLFLGLFDEAAPEVEAKGARREGSGHAKGDLDFSLAVLYTRGDMAHRGAVFIESAWKIPADYQLELIPTDVLEMLYPAPYAGALIKHAPQRNVDPRFLLAIMRQESRFRADVKSYAAARGLMQFISTTSARVAAELSIDGFQQDDLYDPSTAILFGSHYIGNLFKLFPGQPAAVAASYNGGEDNMKRWLARSKSDQPDRYISEILFSQSKDYVYRVLANYRIYQMMYDENLRRK